MIITLITSISVALIGSGIFQYLITRHDGKNDKQKQIENKLETVLKAIDELRETVENNKAEEIRLHILDFTDQTLNGRKRSLERWREHLDMIQKYERHCEKYPNFRNGFCTMSIEQTKELYKELCEKGVFSRENVK